MVTKEQQISYYESEMKKINTNGFYSPKIKVRDEDSETKWINLNDESARVLIKWLKKEFNIK